MKHWVQLLTIDISNSGEADKNTYSSYTNAKLRKSGQDRISPQARDLGQGIWQGCTTGTFWLFEMLLRAAVKETRRQRSRAPKRGNRAGEVAQTLTGPCQSSSRLSWRASSTSFIRGVSDSTHAPAATSRIIPYDDCLYMEKSGNSVVVPELAEPTSTPPRIVTLSSSPF